MNEYEFSIKTPTIVDRFIPNRSQIDFEHSYHMLTDDLNRDPTELSRKQVVNESLLTARAYVNTPYGSNSLIRPKSVLNFVNSSQIIKRDYLDVAFENNYQATDLLNIKSIRRVNRVPIRCETILDAPDVHDDFYLNVVDWSKSNILAVGLDNQVHLWDHDTKISKTISNEGASLSGVFDDADDHVTCVKWFNDGKQLAIATSNGHILIYDVHAEKVSKKMRDQTNRVASLAWNGNLLTSGSSDGLIINHDIRTCQTKSEYRHHTKEICGLSWNMNGRFLASGDDNCELVIWDVLTSSGATPRPYQVIDSHKAAIKAVAWCPYKNHVLASGGGKSDGQIKLWNIYSGKNVHSVQTNSQITGILWSNLSPELVSSHNESDKFKLIIWNYPTMSLQTHIEAHQNRILSMTLSPDSRTVASIGADETVRIWNCFTDQPSSSYGKNFNHRPSSFLKSSASYTGLSSLSSTVR